MPGNKDAVFKYQHSPKGQARRREYENRPDVKEKRSAIAKRRWQVRYSKSEEYKAKKAEYMKEYSKSDSFKASCSAWSKSEAGKESSRRYRSSDGGRAKKVSRSSRPEYRYYQYKRDAGRRGIEFNLTFDQFMVLWRKPCTYCTSSIETIGIDRVNNSVGYVEANIVPCCKICNKMKLDMDQSVFVSHCKKIVAVSNEEKL